jgi:hypothetical protein
VVQSVRPLIETVGTGGLIPATPTSPYKASSPRRPAAAYCDRTVLFVSHNMGAVKNLCNKGVLLENGMVKNVGDIDTVIESYFNQKSKGTNVYFPKNNVVKSVMIFQQQDKIILNLKYESDFLIKQPNFGFVIYDNYENPIFGTNPLQNGILDFGLPKKSGEIISQYCLNDLNIDPNITIFDIP